MIHPEAKRMAEKAKEEGKWLYDHEYRWWYSPEDFEHIFSYANASDEFLKRLQIRDPREGIEAGFKKVAELQNKLQILVRAVSEYYKKFK
ncbi:hypothetical protein EXU57_22970 [Segetibacter sp. 3557_3]|uniref:hypothetical protein n=1 Tax=Segetibacter sp. 3557_3 TaxID=2547429 RepID=UPI001058BC8F|nr:hypothetical protein [Segetibacter sp. 3557_3]TDH18467.1 hypothetical protein EXU57_22970 [Segetibacter sp. 3557_3]